MTTMMPELSSSAAQFDLAGLARKFRLGLRYIVLLMLPAAVLFVVLAQPMVGVLVRGTQRCDALIQGRVAHEKLPESLADAAGNSERGHAVRQRARMTALQRLECADHVAARSARTARSARNSRWRENHMTIMVARMASTSCVTIVEIRIGGTLAALAAEHGPVHDVADDARERRTQRYSPRPGSSVSVTMSPFATWRDLMAQDGFDFVPVCIRLTRPLLTATRALLRRAPVAKALGSGNRISTDLRHRDAGKSGSWRRTASPRAARSSVSLAGWPMTLHAHHAFGHPLGDGQRNQRSAKADQRPEHKDELKLMPRAFSQGSKPSRRSATLATNRIAKLVRTNSRILFMTDPDGCAGLPIQGLAGKLPTG